MATRRRSWWPGPAWRLPTAGSALGLEQVDGLCGIAKLNLVTTKAEIWPASDADLATLATILEVRHWLTDRLARQQQRGGGVLLVASLMQLRTVPWCPPQRPTAASRA
jgi:hypothetical protein